MSNLEPSSVVLTGPADAEAIRLVCQLCDWKSGVFFSLPKSWEGAIGQYKRHFGDRHTPAPFVELPDGSVMPIMVEGDKNTPPTVVANPQSTDQSTDGG